MIQKSFDVTQIASANMGNDAMEIQKSSDASGFKAALSDALKEVSKGENISDRKTNLLSQGKIDDLHDVMVTAKKANIQVEAAVQVQQKVIDIYNEMMRMQV